MADPALYDDGSVDDYGDDDSGNDYAPPTSPDETFVPDTDVPGQTDRIPNEAGGYSQWTTDANGNTTLTIVDANGNVVSSTPVATSGNTQEDADADQNSFAPEVVPTVVNTQTILGGLGDALKKGLQTGVTWALVAVVVLVALHREL